MKKYLLSLIAFYAITCVNAQESFNKWSIDISSGFNKPMGPLTPGYLSPMLNIGHVDLGLRYMINENFGFKADGGFGSFSEVNGISPVFTTTYSRFNLQGILNLGHVLNFNSFSQRLSLLGHMGGGFGMMSFDETILRQGKDYHYNIITGATALFKLSERIALTGDVSVIVNGRQTYTFDGNEYNAPTQPVDPTQNPFVHATGTWWTGTLGLTIYLGKSEKHADWYIPEDQYATKEELASQIMSIKDMLKDSDGDGVPDYLDQESNTPAGARVNSHGVTMDSDGDGVVDHLDKCPFLPGPSSNNGCPIEEIQNPEDYLRKTINEGYTNVYFAFDSAEPQQYSLQAGHYVSNFLKKNPDIIVEIQGFADEIGPEDYNIKLSERRAQAVYDLLISSGVSANQLSYKGYGEDTSVDKNSEDARQMARRTSFKIQ